MLIGDFNLTMNVEIDRLNTYNNNEKAKQELENIMEEFCMVDLWRIRNEDKKEYSWTRKTGRSHRQASRIDFVVVSAGLDQNVKMVEYLASIKTDHRALYVVVDTCPYERGAGFGNLTTGYYKT